MSEYRIFDAGRVILQSGRTHEETRLAYKTYGTLNAAKSNVILYPTSFNAQHYDTEWLIGPGKPLDPSRYFIIVPNLFGNGLSSSPSNSPHPFDAGDYPYFTMADNVRIQHRLLRESFQIQRIALVYGFSMGGQQALHWGALFPEMVERVCAVCASAKTAPHNWVMLDGIKAALTADPAWNGRRFEERPLRGLRAVGRLFAGWALSQAFYRDGLYRQLGAESLDAFIERDWEAAMLRRDAHDLLAQIWTWQQADISANELYRNDLTKALQSIRARTVAMPSQTDLYFTVDDIRAEAALVPDATLLVIPSIWGHRAGNPSKNPADEKFILEAVQRLLAS